MTTDNSTAPQGLTDAARSLLAAVDAELDATWGCNSYHPSLIPAVEAMRAALAAAPHAAPVVQPVVPAGWKLMPPKLTGEMRVALVAAARRYMRDYGGNSPEAMYEAAFAAAPASDADSMQGSQPTKEML